MYTQILREKIGQLVEDAPDLASAVDRIGSQESVFFSERFLAPRPLLEAIRSEQPVVLLIDEVDRADDEFEAFLLEFLSDFTISIPETGTVRAAHYQWTYPAKFEADLVIADEGLPAYGNVRPTEEAIERMIAPVLARLKNCGAI
mgnify:CR=1 FL=1